MLIDTGLTIAYKCSSCGSFEFFNTSLFALLYRKQTRFSCRCKKTGITVTHEGDGGYLVKTPCIGCGNEHLYLLGRKDILRRDLNVFTCHETKIQQCFIGRDEIVRRKIDHLEKELDELIDMFGYDSYFRNTQVMFDSLNRIHDIAEQGNLSCECGNTGIELVLLSDRILLKCDKCHAGKIVRAATNEDLKDTIAKQYILVSKESCGHESETAEEYARKTDEK